MKAVTITTELTKVADVLDFLGFNAEGKFDTEWKRTMEQDELDQVLVELDLIEAREFEHYDIQVENTF